MAGHAKPPEPAVPRPALAFRVGITGTRHLDSAAVQEVRRQIEHVLRHVAKTVSELGARPACRHIYRSEEGEPLRPQLRAVTPLAEGTDRLFAEVAAQLGWDIEIPLPFARDEYAKDFDDASRVDFDRWLGTPGTPDARPYLAIDGGRGDEENRSYESVGRIVVRNCDLLIAVWDGHPAKGRGGTGDIVRFAAKFGPPVWWIDSAGHELVRLIASAADLRRPEDAPSGAKALAVLSETLGRLIEPPSLHHHHTQGLIRKVAHGTSSRSGSPFDPLRAYLVETARPKRGLWRTHEQFFRRISGPPAPSAPPAEADAPDVEVNFWTHQYEPADRASIDYGNRYRSSYILVFGLATLAVACAIIGLAYEPVKPWTTFVELICLGLITALVYSNHKRDWQGRWITYRFLAELCRKQEVLSLLGWSLPASDLRRLGAETSPAQWVGWYFDALMRAAPLASGDLKGERLAYIRKVAVAKLISGQETYHKRRKDRSRFAAHWLSHWGEVFFFATTAIVAVELFLLLFERAHEGRWHVVIVVLSAIAAIIPAVSAAFVGIRAYSEVELLEQQSARLEETMKEADRRVSGLRIDRPLASQDLAADVYEISSEMLHDVNGWADLFLLKAVEAG